MSTKSLSIAEPAAGRRAPYILGLLAAVLGTLFALNHLGSAFLCGAVILALAASENERLLSLVIFLTPVGWFMGKTESLVGAFPARSNVDGALLIRCVVIFGYFLGRFWRGQIGIRGLFQSALARASLAFMATMVISAVLSESDLRLASMIRVALRIVAYLGFFLLILSWCNSGARVEKVAYILLLSTLVLAGFAILQSLSGGYTFIWYYLYPPGSDTFPWDSRATAFLDYPNDLASYLNLILPFALACCFFGGSKWRNPGAWTFVLGTVALVLTQSRGGILGFGCMLLAGIYFLAEKLRTRLLLLCVTGLIAAVVYWGVIAPGADHLGLSDLSSGATRLYLWAVALQLFAGSPLHGVGWGNFQSLYGSYLDQSMVGESQLGVHNTYLALLAETGIFGFVTYVTVLFLGFREARRHLRTSHDVFGRSLAFGVLGAIVALAVQGFVEFQIAFTQFGVLFWTLLALLVVSAQLQSGSAAVRRKVSPAQA